ncbi:M1 family metallopeptidase [Nocardioides sp. LHG3406-4]|uniref:M1 family metallopeptidase n=1 Tax=Nocardioides sp. LHG3406-4 TaxID=2804575 RepID=UPI003CEEAA8B
MSTDVDPYVPGHGDLSYDVVHYDLDLAYDVPGNRLDGTATISGVAREVISELRLDLHALDVTKVALDHKPVKYRDRKDTLTVRPATPIPVGESFTLTVRYAGRPTPIASRTLGSSGWEELEDGVIVAGQPHGAPSWFPCNDRPSNKATYRISLAVPTDYRVIANGRLTSSRRRSSSVVWVHEQDQPMATYLATVHVGRYELRTDEGDVDVHTALPRRLQAMYDDTFGDQRAMLDTFVRLFGPYPFEAYTVVVTDDDLEIPLEAQGLAAFGANILTGEWSSIRLVAHELSHQWFGNSLTLDRWQDIWLHEGFACYAEWIWSEESGGRTAQDHAEEHHARLSGLGQDLLLADPGPELMFDDRVYKRGALLLHALRLTVGDDAFFGLVRAWTAKHAHGTVNSAGFMEFADLTTGRELVDLFDRWLYRAALPELPPAP